LKKSTLFNTETANADEKITKNEIELVEPDHAIVRRQYIDVYRNHFTASSAPTIHWFSRSGFSGNLTLFYEEELNDGTVNGYYRGYVYNDNYPIPLESPIETNSTSWEITEHRTMENAYDFPSTISVNNSSYSGILVLEELWQSQDGTWTGIYTGTVRPGYGPINLIEEK